MGDNEHFDIRDERHDLSGEDLAYTVKRSLTSLEIDKAISGSFLGLGAGYGNAERALAEKLSISTKYVTLVDKYKVSYPDFEGMPVQSDMFVFLNQCPEKFGIITVFCVEYVILEENNWLQLWQGLQLVTSPGSIVVIFPIPRRILLPPGTPFEVKKWEDSLLIAVRTSGEGDVAVSEVTQ